MHDDSRFSLISHGTHLNCRDVLHLLCLYDLSTDYLDTIEFPRYQICGHGPSELSPCGVVVASLYQFKAHLRGIIYILLRQAKPFVVKFVGEVTAPIFEKDSGVHGLDISITQFGASFLQPGHALLPTLLSILVLDLPVGLLVSSRTPCLHSRAERSQACLSDLQRKIGCGLRRCANGSQSDFCRSGRPARSEARTKRQLHDRIVAKSTCGSWFHRPR